MKNRSLLPLVTIAILVAVFAGCLDDADSKVLATVGDREITLEYYEMMLGKMTQNDLPTENGEVVDTATSEGKHRFLEVIINKELMALKAEQNGYDKSEEVSGLVEAVSGYKAINLMIEELINEPSQTVSPGAVDDYYSMLKTKRHFNFILCNFAETAIEARDLLLAGGLWEDIADEYNDGSKGPNSDYTLSVEYGRAEDSFEDVLFSAELGEISMPVETVYGFFILRLNSIEEVDVPPLDEQFRDRIKMTLVARQKNSLTKQFLDDSKEKHGYFMDDDALWVIYQGLPEDEPFLNPDTDSPTPKEQLAPLDIDVEDLSTLFMSCQFDLDADPEEWTIGDFKSMYDNWNVFQRPKRSSLKFGLKAKLEQEIIEKRLKVSEATERGYMDDSRVDYEVKQRIEEMMVTKLFDEVIVVDERVTPEQFDEYWAEHSFEFVNNQTGAQMTKDEARSYVGRRIVDLRKDELLRSEMEKWREEFGVVINEKNLELTASWPELVPIENIPVGPIAPAAN